jgi:HEAT repeat protein
MPIFLLFWASGAVLAGQESPFPAPPRDQGPTGDRESGPNLQDPPRESPEALKKRLDRLQKMIEEGNGKGRSEAVEALLVVENPLAADALVTGLLLLPAEEKRRCARRLTVLGEAFPASKVPDQILAALKTIKKIARSNADTETCSVLFAFLLKSNREGTLPLLREFLKFVAPSRPLLELLLHVPGDGGIRSLSEIAGDSSPHRRILRQEAVRTLGFWGSGPPRYALRIPVLLKALGAKTDLAREALQSLQRIAIFDGRHARDWKVWWKSRQTLGGDTSIVLEDMEEEYRRLRGVHLLPKGGREEADLNEIFASGVETWIWDWNTPAFRWALPVLHKVLADPRCRGARKTVMTNLGGIGDVASLLALRRAEKKIDRARERLLLTVCIRSMARAAAGAEETVRIQTGEHLAPYLDDLHEKIVSAASDAMGILAFKASTRKLVAIMKSPKRSIASRHAAEALGMMKAVDTLDEILAVHTECLETDGHASAALACSALKALEWMNLPTPDVVRQLIPSLGVKNETICLEAVRLLGETWRREEAVPALRLLFDDAKRSVPLREKVLEALTFYPPGPATEILIEVLGRRFSPQERNGQDFYRVARNHFRKSGTLRPEHRRHLLALVTGGDRELSGKAFGIRLLGRRGIWENESGAEALVPLVGHRDADLKIAVREVLSAHPSHKAMDLLIHALPDPPPTPEDWVTGEKHYIMGIFLIRAHRKKGFREPNFNWGRKRWITWWKRNGKYLEFPKEE